MVPPNARDCCAAQADPLPLLPLPEPVTCWGDHCHHCARAQAALAANTGDATNSRGTCFSFPPASGRPPMLSTGRMSPEASWQRALGRVIHWLRLWSTAGMEWRATGHRRLAELLWTLLCSGNSPNSFPSGHTFPPCQMFFPILLRDLAFSCLWEFSVQMSFLPRISVIANMD